MVCRDSDKADVLLIQNRGQIISPVNVSEVAILDAVHGKHVDDFSANEIAPYGRKMQKHKNFLGMLGVL